MPRTFPAPVDPVFAEITKAIYGDVDAREIAALGKSLPGSSDVHVDGPVDQQEARRQRRVAQTGLAANGVATVAGLDATRAALKEGKHRVAEGKEGRAVGPVARQLVRMKMSPKAAGLAVGTGLLGLHAVELGADAMGAHAQLKQLRQANTSLPNTKKPVAKGFRLRALNSMPNRIPSLRAKRPKLTPSPANPTTKAGLYQPVGKGLRSFIRAGRTTARTVRNTTAHAEGAAKQAEEATKKINDLIPSRRTAILAATGVGGALIGGPAVGSYAGSYAGTRHGRGKLAPVAKSEPVDVSWSGTITKVDTDKRQVFGWASVSAVNGQNIVDLQGDIVPIEEMEKSAYRYVIESRKGGDMHKRVAKADQPLHTADMIESFVVTPEKLEKMGLPPDALPHGWWVGYHVNDDNQWAMVKSGERQGFSIHGAGRRTAVDKRAPNRVPVDPEDHPTHPIRLLRRLKEVREGGAPLTATERASLVINAAAHYGRPLSKREPVRNERLTPVGVPMKRKLKPLNGGKKAPIGARLHLFAPHIDTANKVLARGLTPHGLVSVADHLMKADRTTQGLAAGSAATGGAAVGLGVAAHRKYRLADKQAHNASRRLGYAAQTIAGGANVTDHRLPGPPNVIPNKKAMRTLDRMIGEGNSEHRQAFKTLKRAGRLGHGATAAAVGSVALGSAAVARHRRLSKASRLDDLKDKAGDARDKAAKQVHRATSDLKRRADQAIHPPPVKTHRVRSSAVRSMGYQPQTRRLAVEMRSRKGRPYEYKMKTGAAVDALTAPSKGYHFATQIRGKAQRAEGYSPADRARLFLSPVSKAGPKELGSRPPQTGHRDEGFGANARPADGRRITDKPRKYSLKGNAKEFRRGAGGGFMAGATKVTYTGPGGNKYANKAFKHAFKQRVAAEALGSPHPGAFRTGVRAGRGAVRAAKYGPYALVGTSVVAAGKKAVDDHREADRRIAARQQLVGKGLDTAGLATALAAGTIVGGYGGMVAGSEINRKLYNKHGAQLKPFESAVHPIRAQYKASVGANQRAATVQLNRAEKATDPRKAELHRIRAERYNAQANRYARKAGIRKGMVNGGPAHQGLPGDNRDAQMSRTRRTAGLSTAGIGYLVASRGKDVAPSVAEAVTRAGDYTHFKQANRISGKPRKQLIRARGKTFRKLSGRGGTALMGAGLALAGEGAFNDLRNRGAFGRTGQQVREKLRKSAFGIEDERLEKGLFSAATKIAGGAKSFLPKLKPIKATPEGLKLSTAGKVGIGAVGVGGIGALGNSQLGKAFNSERSRHGRQDMYAGGATGGAVAAGAGAVAVGRKARDVQRVSRKAATRSAEHHLETQSRLQSLSHTVGLGDEIADAAKTHRSAVSQADLATRLASKAKKLRRISGAAGLGAAALGVGAGVLHDYDRRRGGRSYGY